MKIAILTSGVLPVPAVQGGAVENLIDFYLEYNEWEQLHDITVYSVAHPDTQRHPALQSKANHYHYIDTESLMGKIRKHLFHRLHKQQEYYHYTIEYYLHEAIRHISRQHYDLIIIENRPAYALKLKKITNARLVYHLHNEKLDNRSKYCQEIYDAATRIITVSDYIASRVRTIQPHDTKCITVHNGIDLQAFTMKKELRDKEVGRPFTLVFSGRINREKGVMELIEAMNLLKGQGDIRLLIIGSSFYGNANNDNPFADELKARAADLQERITFTGFVPYKQMPIYLSQADVAVVPSVWDDPFPTTVLEALAMGLPVIATRRGGIPEEVTPETAILLDTDEHFVEHLASAILDLYEHPEKRRAMSEAALEHARLFDKERYAREFFETL